MWINSLAPGRSWYDFKNVIFNLALLIGIFKSSDDNVLRWMPQDLTDDKSTLVHVMAWCFSTRASVATVLTMHPCVSWCLRFNYITIIMKHMIMWNIWTVNCIEILKGVSFFVILVFNWDILNWGRRSQFQVDQRQYKLSILCLIIRMDSENWNVCEPMYIYCVHLL